MNGESIKNGLFDPRTLTSAGAVVICIILILTGYKLLGNHLEHVDATLRINAESQGKVSESLNNLNTSIQHNNRLMEQLLLK